ncbi:MAG: hypothetical protein K6T30_01690 [Alicyclobacillus sp.]|nr:hypothetical protein [Alicyclobacillus sp.]
MKRDSVWQQMAARVDDWLIPMAFGLLCVLVLAQGVAAIPAVRERMDEASGRLVAVRAGIPAVSSATASFTLYLSPAAARPDIEVWVNGRLAGDFSRPSVRLTVRDGDRVEVSMPKSGGLAYVRVDHDDPSLLAPAPGQVFELSPNAPVAVLPVVEVVG